MRVGVQGHRYGRVSQELSDLLGVHVSTQEQGEASMPEIVEADGRSPARSKSSMKDRCLRLEGFMGVTPLSGENEPLVLVVIAQPISVPWLPLKVASQGVHSRARGNIVREDLPRQSRITQGILPGCDRACWYTDAWPIFTEDLRMARAWRRWRSLTFFAQASIPLSAYRR